MYRCFLFLTIILIPTIVNAGQLFGPGQDEFDREIGTIGDGTDYELFRPPGFDSVVKELPLVVFMHGSTDGLLSKQSRLNETMFNLVQTTQRANSDRHRVNCVDSTGADDPDCSDFDQQFASFLLVPKQTTGGPWTGRSRLDVNTLIDDLFERYEIDPNRVYLTGFSDGGFSTVRELSDGGAERFAAGVPISGGGPTSTGTVEALKEVPMWFFHGGADPVVSPSSSSDLHEALLAAGGESRLTLVPGGSHNSGYTEAFRDTRNEFYPWLFSQSMAVPEPSSPATFLLAIATMLITMRRRVRVRPLIQR